MKKIIKLVIISIIFTISTFSFSTFFNNDFKARVVETSFLNNTKRVKEYNVNYTRDELEIEILSPKVNEGEKYYYTKNSKKTYYPKLKREVTEKLDETEINLYNILKNIRNNTTSNKGEKYIYGRNGDIVKIIGSNYKIIFQNYRNGKPNFIKYIDYNNSTIEYVLEYK